MNIQNLMANVTPEQLEKLDQNLNKIVPFIEDKLPMLVDLQEAWRKEYNVSKDDLFFYSAIKAPNKNKILIYVWSGYFAPEKHTFSNGRVIEKNTIVISGEIKAFELMEFLKATTANGLSGLLDKLF